MPVAYQVKFETITIGDHAFEIRSLKDRQQYADPHKAAQKAGVSSASWPLFGVLWPSGIMLADMMDSYPVKGLRVLEVGCGLGLASLVAHRRGADITASDYHPLAEKFMEQNIKLNKLKPLDFKCIHWKTIDKELGQFDLIIGSDILYEPDHPALLSRFIERHATENCTIIVVDPGRRQRTEFSKRMIDNGYSLIPHTINHQLAALLEFTGRVLVYRRRQ
jgi:predicted nicotinamide N-methyase